MEIPTINLAPIFYEFPLAKSYYIWGTDGSFHEVILEICTHELQYEFPLTKHVARNLRRYVFEKQDKNKCR